MDRKALENLLLQIVNSIDADNKPSADEIARVLEEDSRTLAHEMNNRTRAARLH